MLELSKILAQTNGRSLGDLYYQYNQNFLKEGETKIVVGGIDIPTTPSTRPLTEEEIRYRESLQERKQAA
jgi:hypothetical protein